MPFNCHSNLNQSKPMYYDMNNAEPCETFCFSRHRMAFETCALPMARVILQVSGNVGHSTTLSESLRSRVAHRSQLLGLLQLTTLLSG